MVAWQRAMGESRSIVTDGRDQGTVVFKDARYKFYVDAMWKNACSAVIKN
jgi:cytidylate kinase